MYNKTILIGNLGTDVELKNTSGGKAVANFRMATSYGSGDKESTEWHNIEVWEKTAENAAKFLKKGSKVFVEGRIRTRSYEKDGATKYITEIVGEKVQFLDSAPKGRGQEQDLPF